MMITHLVYTHSDYSRAWPLLFGQLHKYFANQPIVVMVDQQSDLLPPQAQLLIYDQAQPYQQRIRSCVEKLDPNLVVLFLHEDMILYQQPDYNLLQQFSNLVATDQAQVIKLLRAGDYKLPSMIHPQLYYNSNNMNYCIQPSLIKVSNLDRVYQIEGDSIWQFEKNAMNQMTMPDSYYYYGDEPIRGLSHYDSNAYPFIATAIVKGEWNVKEYHVELNALLDEYKVNHI